MNQKIYKINSHKSMNAILSFFFLSLIFMFSCKESENPIAETNATEIEANKVVLTDDQFKMASLSTTKVTPQKMGGMIQLNGISKISPENLVTVNAQLGGFVKSIKLLPGMSIAKGQVVAILEDKEYVQLQQDYLMVKSTLYYAKKEFERQKELNKTQASSDKVLLQAEEVVKSKSIELKGLEQKLLLIQINPKTLSDDKISSNILLCSPVTGIVKEVNVNTGKYVLPGDPILQIIDASQVLISLKAFEKDVAQLSIGDKLKIYTNNKPDEKLGASVTLIGPMINADGYTEIICTLVSKPKFHPGTYVMADIETASLDRLALPENAIVSYEGQDYIFIELENREYQMIEISTGIHENGYIEIVNHQPFKNKNVVLNGAYTLLMKLKNVAE